MKRKIIKVLAFTIITCSAIPVNATPVNWNAIEVNDIDYYMQTNKSVYELSESVEMLFRVTNLREEEVTIYCSRSPEFNFLVRDGEETIWSSNQWFQWHSPGITIPAGESIELTYGWNMEDDDDNLVEPGIYDIVGVMYNEPWNEYNGLGANITEVVVPVTIIPEPSSLAILIAGLSILITKRKVKHI